MTGLGIYNITSRGTYPPLLSLLALLSSSSLPAYWGTYPHMRVQRSASIVLLSLLALLSLLDVLSLLALVSLLALASAYFSVSCESACA